MFTFTILPFLYIKKILCTGKIRTTDSGQKYMDASSFLYIFHINLQLNFFFILKSIHVRF